MKARIWIPALLVIAVVGARTVHIGSHPKTVATSGTPNAELPIRTVCRREKVEYPPKRVFIRIFKVEREMELWGGNSRGVMHLLRAYPIAAASGGPGPKTCEGDLQVPEGAYRVNHFNPNSSYHLSLGLNYPNEADRIRGGRRRLGSDIYIHGNHVSAGCMAMTDPKIEEIYSLASHAKGGVPVHIFPCRMNTPAYTALTRDNPHLISFWNQLEPIQRAFDVRHVVPHVSVTANGGYVVDK